MQPKEQILQDKDRGLNHIGQNFLVGTLFGLIPLFLSFLYYVFLGDSMDWNTFGTKFLVALPILSGILSAVFRKRFVAMLSDFMSYLGQIHRAMGNVRLLDSLVMKAFRDSLLGFRL